MGDHALLSALKERLGITLDTFDVLLNRYLSDEEVVHELSVSVSREAVVITMFAESDFYLHLSKESAERIKYSESNRSVDPTMASENYRALALAVKIQAEEMLKTIRGEPVLRYLRYPSEDEQNS